MEMPNQQPPVETPPPQQPPTPPQRPRSIVGPAILIILGVTFMLSNLGYIGWNIWELMYRLWPVWLVAAGLDLLLGRRSAWGGWIALGIVLALVGGLGWFVQSAGSGYTSMAAESFSQTVDGARRAEITISPSVGRLTLRESTEASVLARGSVTPLPGERIQRDFRVDGDLARFSLRSREGTFVPFGGRSPNGAWDVELSPAVPMTLRIDTGVGKAEIDLSKLQVTDLRLNTGVGEATITLPSTGRIRVDADSGVGALTIRIPEGMAARVDAEAGLGNVSVRGDFQRSGRYYVTPDYDSAANQATIDVDGGVGSIRIEYVR